MRGVAGAGGVRMSAAKTAEVRVITAKAVRAARNARRMGFLLNGGI
jgi:hypothetical protein